MRDIATRADIETLMRAFYARLLELEDMQRVFEGIDLEQHLPNIIHFWSFVLLDEEGYKTNVFDKHRPLPIHPPQFDTWLRIFRDTVNGLFSGEKAELAVQRATVLAHTFKSKWEQLKNEQ